MTENLKETSLENFLALFTSASVQISEVSQIYSQVSNIRFKNICRERSNSGDRVRLNTKNIDYLFRS